MFEKPMSESLAKFRFGGTFFSSRGDVLSGCLERMDGVDE